MAARAGCNQGVGLAWPARQSHGPADAVSNAVGVRLQGLVKQ